MPGRKVMRGGTMLSVHAERMVLATAMLYEGETLTSRTLANRLGMSWSAAKRMLTTLEVVLGPRVEVTLTPVRGFGMDKAKREMRRKA